MTTPYATSETTEILAVVFDYGFTMSSEYYFNVPHPSIPNWRELIQECAFSDQAFNDGWMIGQVTLTDLAQRLQEKTAVDAQSILTYLNDGCRSLKENHAVVEFARRLKAHQIPIAMVTVNFDVFNDIIVPEHGYEQLFDVVVNSCDHGTIDKRVLWPIAFEQLGPNIGYGNALLIEDGPAHPQLFRDAGGQAIEYADDLRFRIATGKLVLRQQRLQYLLQETEQNECC